MAADDFQARSWHLLDCDGDYSHVESGSPDVPVKLLATHETASPRGCFCLYKVWFLE